jgi:hypothetical protein
MPAGPWRVKQENTPLRYSIPSAYAPNLPIIVIWYYNTLIRTVVNPSSMICAW